MASTTTAARQNVSGMPDIKVSARQLFGIDTDMEVPAFSAASEHVPVVDEAYLFDHDTTMAIIAVQYRFCARDERLSFLSSMSPHSCCDPEIVGLCCVRREHVAVLRFAKPRSKTSAKTREQPRRRRHGSGNPLRPASGLANRRRGAQRLFRSRGNSRPIGQRHELPDANRPAADGPINAYC